ncbi:hypothetical protein CRJUMX02_1990003 [Escherichia coli]|nr:hypothetical protein CRJUMX02_1990003 [Escherichia coli]
MIYYVLIEDVRKCPFVLEFAYSHLS